MWTGKGQATLHMNFTQIHRGYKNDKSATRPYIFSNDQICQCGFVCDSIQSQTPIVCFSSFGQSSLWDRCLIHELEQSTCLCISTNNSDIICSNQNPSILVKNSSNCSSLASTSLVLNEVLQLQELAPIRLPYFPNLLTSIGKVSTSKPPNSCPSRLVVIKESIRVKKFSQNVADLSQNQEEHHSTQKVCDAKWVIYSNWCNRKKVNLVMTFLTVIADFLIYLFSEKKCQISTIKGYRSMISNTLKFKSGNRIDSNPVLSELIRSFELQHPVQRSLTPKWDFILGLNLSAKAPLSTFYTRLTNFTLRWKQPFY